MTRTALLALTVSAFALPAAAEEIKMMADLSGANQVPPVETEATGMADITLDTEAMTVSWRLSTQGLSGEPVAAHFHGPATPEENAGVVIDLAADIQEPAEAEPVPMDIMMGSSAITEEQMTQLQEGLWYVNVHTEANPDGEIRGQAMAGEADTAAMDEMDAMMPAAN